MDQMELNGIKCKIIKSWKIKGIKNYRETKKNRELWHNISLLVYKEVDGLIVVCTKPMSGIIKVQVNGTKNLVLHTCLISQE